MLTWKHYDRRGCGKLVRLHSVLCEKSTTLSHAFCIFYNVSLYGRNKIKKSNVLFSARFLFWAEILRKHVYMCAKMSLSLSAKIVNARKFCQAQKSYWWPIAMTWQRISVPSIESNPSVSQVSHTTTFTQKYVLSKIYICFNNANKLSLQPAQIFQLLSFFFPLYAAFGTMKASFLKSWVDIFLSMIKFTTHNENEYSCCWFETKRHLTNKPCDWSSLWQEKYLFVCFQFFIMASKPASIDHTSEVMTSNQFH